MHVSAAGVSSCFILLYFTLLFMLHVAQHVVTAGNILSATITTVAGTGTAGFSGDNGQATSANLRAPIGVFVRSSGEMYISDQSGSHRIRKVSSTGIINTIAGTGTNGYNGDNIAATAAQLNLPQNTFVTSSGEIYIADNTNHRIRKIDTSGKIWTVAGTGTLGTAGDGQLAKNAQLSLPRSVFVTPSGEMYIAEWGRVRKVNANGYISTFAGTGVQGNTGDNQLATSAQLYMPYYVFVESKSGEVYIADYYAHVIRKVKTNGIIVTIAGTGTNGYNGDNIAATSAQLDSPSCVVVSNFGEIFISDAVNNRIRKIDRNGIISTVAGTGTAAFAGDGGLPQNAQLKRPMTLSIPDGSSDIFFSDYGNLRIRKISITCQSGYGGANCDIFTCSSIPATDPTVCSGHGTCGAPNSCSCHSGYSGSNCEMLPITCYGLASTDSNVCSGHGTCTASDTCQCSWNYTGSNCELPKCNGIASNDLIHVCSGHGTCTGVDTCSCQTGYTGQFCSEAICNNKAASAPDVCHGHGSCNAPNTCLCSNNYTGSDCEIPTCYGIPSNDSRVCSGNGSCVSPQTCECNHLYGGSNCSIPKCFNLMDPTMVCSGHGTCLAPDQCQCDSQWSGIQCEIPKCYGYSATLVSNVQ
ncbi:hypothetical protein C9374_011613 [Naegleria lovaniensis]|uniref:EGF-like domain-containing protein n=1 Tax=Naegleria lovaniensis TaxID=51637 RepID=A0AA88GFJ1_NAELO|nr:uncharacterized protein C9374_011613 [Naegleria lovaniensis]KAG2373948.1 hypothetical protein C9374_011613 [Naegleria lovaniensis]